MTAFSIPIILPFALSWNGADPDLRLKERLAFVLEGNAGADQKIGTLLVCRRLSRSCSYCGNMRRLDPVDCGYQKSLYLILDGRRWLGLNLERISDILITHCHIEPLAERQFVAGTVRLSTLQK